MNALSKALEREPSPPMPLMLDPDQITQLGYLRGVAWFTVPGDDAEYELLNDRPIRDRDTRARLTDGEAYVMGEIDGELDGQPIRERVWHPTRRHPGGTFTRGGKAAPVAPRRKVKPLRRISVLPRVPLFASKPELTFSIQGNAEPGTGRYDPLVIRPGRSSARGWRGAAARLNGLGLTLVPVPGGRVTLASPGGAATIEAIDTFERVAPWVAAGLAGKPWPCAWCEAEAETLLAGGVPACAEHAEA